MTYTIQKDSVCHKKFKINVTASYRWYNNIPPLFLPLLLNGSPYFLLNICNQLLIYHPLKNKYLNPEVHNFHPKFKSSFTWIQMYYIVDINR